MMLRPRTYPTRRRGRSPAACVQHEQPDGKPSKWCAGGIFPQHSIDLSRGSPVFTHTFAFRLLSRQCLVASMEPTNDNRQATQPQEAMMRILLLDRNRQRQTQQRSSAIGPPMASAFISLVARLVVSPIVIWRSTRMI